MRVSSSSTKTYLPYVLKFVSEGKKTRFLHLLEFLVPYRDSLRNQEWPTADLVALIKAMETQLSSPSDHGGFGHDWRVHPLVNVWVDTLAGRVDEESVAGLGGLADDPAMKNWSGMLRRARDEQAWQHRIAAYTAPSLPEIRDALRGGPPAGAADLAALVSDKLANLAERIRKGNTDAWQQYWHTDADDRLGRKVTKPKTENACRDALLSDLQFLLEPHKVDAQPEGHQAEDARSDIIAVHGTHAVVVEIKKTDSKDLWRAMNDQLIAKYMRDPRSGGYGIYLVLWFGSEHVRRSPPSGTRPKTPKELVNGLSGALTQQQRRTVTVIVVDVSAPAGRLVEDSSGTPLAGQAGAALRPIS